VAATRADAFGQAMGAQLAQVVPKLPEAVGSLREPMQAQHTSMDLAAGPVGHERIGVEQDLEQADHAVVLQLQPRHGAGRCGRR